MTTIEVLFLLQNELLENLKKAEKNFKKTPKERLKQPYIETRLEVLDQQFSDFKEGHKAILSKASIERKEPYFTEEKYECFEERYVQYKTMLREALQPFLPSQTLSTPSMSYVSSVPTSEHYYDVRLPRLNLPTFSGKYEEWQTFYDMFSSLIHNNKNITSVQKLHYLKGQLSGEAQNLLSNFSTTEANYDEAWKQLVRRYDNKRYNCNAVLRILFALKKMQTESAYGIKHLVDTTSTCLKSLQNMGISTSTWDAIIVFLIVTKLDPETVKQWELHINTVHSDELPTWEQLRSYLESKFRSLEMIDSNVSRPTPPVKPVSKTKTFPASIENKPKTSEAECAMCHEKHYIYQCKQFGHLTPNERQDFVQNNRLCFNCLSPTHAAMKCRQSTSCRKCGRRHHTMLHFEREKRETNQDTTLSSEAVATTSRGDTHITAAFSRELQPNRVLLVTARVKVLNSIGCKQTTRILLDQGSQASFITEATVQLLGLTRKPVSGWVSGLGDGSMRIKNTVSFRVKSRHNPQNSIHVNAYVLHSLTSLLPATKLRVPEWTEIGNLPLADPTYTVPGKIDILLGAEAYSEILLDGVMKQTDGSLIAQNTIFGWILSGRVAHESGELTKVNVTR